MAISPVRNLDAVTALRVGAPRQVGAAFHIASQKGLLILGDDLRGGDNVTDEGSSGLGRTVSDGAGTVQYKVLFYPSCQVLVPARLTAAVQAAEGGRVVMGS